MEESVKEVYRQFRTAQDKICYFLLAVAASAIALTIRRTETVIFSWYLIPLGLAVLSWMVSFYSGVMFLMYMASGLFANYKRLVTGEEMLNQVIGHNSERMKLFAKIQFLLLIIGVVFYIIWHLIEMYNRTTLL